jgi:hypothetical protein
MARCSRGQHPVDRRSLGGGLARPYPGVPVPSAGQGTRAGPVCHPETLTLDPLPCWKDLSPEEYRRRIADLVAEIEEDPRVAREAKGVEPLGVDAVRRQQPHTRPNRTKKSPAPLFHTVSKKAYLNLREAYSRFVAAFRDAAEKLKAGDRTVAFPDESFPPAGPFVRPAFT